MSESVKYTLFYAIGVVTLLFLASCGHTAYHKVEGTGVYARIPLPSGSSLAEAAIGDISITSGVLRGGATYEENTSKGGTFGSVSLARKTYLSTEPAMNEGYLKDVFVSENTDDATKQKLAEYLISRTPREPAPSAVTSVNSAASTGEKPPEAVPTKTGIDNAVDKATEVAPKIVEPITKTTENVVKEVTTTVDNVSTDWQSAIMWICIVAVIGVVIISGIAGVILYKRKKKLSLISTKTAS